MPKVLIVDDEPSTVELLRVYLSMKGFQVICAYSGSEAIEFAEIEHPDVIVLDMMLPIISGEDVCVQVRRNIHTNHIPIIILSALQSQRDQNRAIAAGANYYMTKPIRFPQLLDQLKRMLALV